jgi:hypothetical protein
MIYVIIVAFLASLIVLRMSIIFARSNSLICALLNFSGPLSGDYHIQVYPMSEHLMNFFCIVGPEKGP